MEKKAARPIRGGRRSVPKSLAEFAAYRRQKIKIIFHRDMCVEKIPLRLPVWNFGVIRRNYARSSL